MLVHHVLRIHRRRVHQLRRWRRARRVRGRGCSAVQAVEEAAVLVNGLDLVPSLEAALCAVQSVRLAVRVYFENFEALKWTL